MRPCGLSMNTRTPFLPRMAYSARCRCRRWWRQDVEGFAAARQFVLEQVASSCIAMSFEGQRRAVGQGFQVQAVFQVAQGVISPVPKVARCRFFGQGAQVGGRDIVDVERQDLKRQVGIALGVVRRAPASTTWHRPPAGKCSGRYRPPSGARPSSRIRRSACGLGAARAEVQHQASSSLRIDDGRQHGGQGLHLRQRCSSWPSLRVVVRMMRSVWVAAFARGPHRPHAAAQRR